MSNTNLIIKVKIVETYLYTHTIKFIQIYGLEYDDPVSIIKNLLIKIINIPNLFYLNRILFYCNGKEVIDSKSGDPGAGGTVFSIGEYITTENKPFFLNIRKEYEPFKNFEKNGDWRFTDKNKKYRIISWNTILEENLGSIGENKIITNNQLNAEMIFPSIDNRQGLFGPSVTRFSGIHHLDFYTDLPDNRKILLLGELHKDEGCYNCNLDKFCISIDEYIYALTGFKKECIDFFLEQRYNINDKTIIQTGGLNKQSIYRSRIFWTFNKNIPFLRLHNWDLRIPIQKDNNPKVKDVLGTHYIIMDDLAQKISFTIPKYSNKRRLCYLLFSYFTTFLSDNLREKAEEYLNFSKIITIQHKNYIDFVRKKINKQFLKSYFSHKYLFKDFIYKCFNIWYDYSFKENNYLYSFIHLSLCITDIYIFLRMFINYDKEKMDRSIEGCKNSYNKNIIVYGGARHIENLSNFIKYFLNKEPLYHILNNDISNQCLPIYNPVQFF